MPLALADHHREFRSSMRRMARERFVDGYLERSLQDEYAFDTYRELGKLGLHGLSVPTALGGDGADAVSLGIVCEELGWADQGVASQFAVAALAHSYLAQRAQTAVAERWLPGLLSGELLCCVALTEPEVGSDAANISTRAERVEGGWRITGEKASITASHVADLAIVMAKTDPSAGARGVSAFLVDLDDASVARQVFRDPGLRSVGRGSLNFDGTFVPDDHLLGEEGRGFHNVMELFDLSRSMIGTLVTGGAQRAIDMAAEYVTQREAFGQPISRNQGVSFVIAEHTTLIDLVRTYSYHSLSMIDAGERNTLQAASIKWHAPRAALDAIRECVALHGNVGWSDELPLQALFRDVSAYLIADGTAQIQKLLVARHVLGREAVDG
ncbi:acyl-CoA dehydrogenase family protein [Aeromicrobium sp. CTD01-1L150]|uniref:acyl-CoA dehydrogenase family protein n=1 Tax=Aeromicrobium sp. CTD01-1L150 TaxID=3341830 RepID=UPI0035C1C90C